MNYEDLSLLELREIAKEREIKNVSKLKKQELIEVLTNSEIEKVEESKEIKAQHGREPDGSYKPNNENDQIAEGILEVMPDGYGFLRGDNYLSTTKDIYISPVQIRRFHLDTGDRLEGVMRNPKEGEKFPALIYVGEVNGQSPELAYRRKKFDDLIPIYPNEKIKMETTSNEYAMRIIDLK